MFRRILHAISEGKLLSFAPKSLPGSIGDGTAGMGGRANGDVGGTAGIVPSWTPSVPRTTSVWPVRERAPVRPPQKLSLRHLQYLHHRAGVDQRFRRKDVKIIFERETSIKSTPAACRAHHERGGDFRLPGARLARDLHVDVLLEDEPQHLALRRRPRAPMRRRRRGSPAQITAFLATWAKEFALLERLLNTLCPLTHRNTSLIRYIQLVKKGNKYEK